MAKSATVEIRLVSTAETGFPYITRKNARKMSDKLMLRKYGSRPYRKQVMFREAKIKS
ncbi:MAG: 50S ribosomal protein L33 [Hyphomicrobiales bacterium]